MHQTIISEQDIHKAASQLTDVLLNQLVYEPETRVTEYKLECARVARQVLKQWEQVGFINFICTTLDKLSAGAAHDMKNAVQRWLAETQGVDVASTVLLEDYWRKVLGYENVSTTRQPRPAFMANPRRPSHIEVADLSRIDLVEAWIAELER